MLIIWVSVWGWQLVRDAENLAAELRSTGSSAEMALAGADLATIEEISDSLDNSLNSARQLDQDLWPIRLAGAVLGGVPVFGDNLIAGSKLADRLNDDLSAAVALVDVAELLMTVYDELPTGDSGLVETLNNLPTDIELIEAMRLLDIAETDLVSARDTSDAMNESRLLGALKAKSQELSIQERRLIELVQWARLTTESLIALVRLGEISSPLIGLVESGNQSESGLASDTFRTMSDLENAAANAHLAVVSANADAPSGIAGSEIGNLLVDFESLLQVLSDLSRAGVLIWTGISPALDEMESSQGGLIGQDTSILTALKILNEGQAVFEDAELILDSVDPYLRTVKFNSPSGMSGARTLSDVSNELTHLVGFLADFPEIGTKALGSIEPKRYLILGQTSDELRGSGGFVSSAWILTFNAGQMSNVEYHDIVEIDDLDGLDLYPLPPDLLAQHMDAPVWLLRDAMWSPEYPVAAHTASGIFELGHGGPSVDGVIALTEWAIVGLVEALGTIETDNGEIAPGELLPALEEGTDVDGRAFVDVLFRGLLDELRSSNVNDRIFGITRAASEMLKKKDVLVYMSDPSLQEVISRAGWDGSLGKPEGDRITVIDSNVGWNKVDRNIERSFEYRVTLRPFQPSPARLSISYRNMSIPNGDGCVNQAPLHGISYKELKQACYWNLVRVYVPDGGSLLSGDPLPIPEGSVYARAAAGLPGDDSLNVGIDSGGKFISGLIVVPPSETVTTEFDLTVPVDAFVLEEGLLFYRLLMNSQAGALGRKASITLELPVGYEYVSSSHTPSLLESNIVEFDISLESDTMIEVSMQSGSEIGNNLIGPNSEISENDSSQ